MPDTRVTFRQWLDDHHRMSIERAGRALSFVPKGAPRGNPERDPDNCNDPRLRTATAKRQAGEIINPTTGEVLTKCLTVAIFAKTIGVSSRALIGDLKTLGLLHNVLEWKAVPMVQAYDLVKPEYSHRARLTPWALESGYGVTIAAIAASARSGRGMQVKCDFVTPEGQRYVAERLAKEAERTPTSSAPKTVDVVRGILEREPKVSNREIARRLGFSRQAIQKHRRQLAV